MINEREIWAAALQQQAVQTAGKRVSIARNGLRTLTHSQKVKHLVMPPTFIRTYPCRMKCNGVSGDDSTP